MYRMVLDMSIIMEKTLPFTHPTTQKNQGPRITSSKGIRLFSYVWTFPVTWEELVIHGHQQRVWRIIKYSLKFLIGKHGATPYEPKKVMEFPDQKFGDSKLEMISFSGPVALATERFIHGQGRRVGQVEGPFVFNFKRNDDTTKPLSTYMQIDGEYFQLLAPKCVHIRLASSLPNGKVKVLVNSAKKN